MKADLRNVDIGTFKQGRGAVGALIARQFPAVAYNNERSRGQRGWKAHIGLKMSSANVERIVRTEVTFPSPADVTCALGSSLRCERAFVEVVLVIGG